jgi:hypothetical protein
MAPPSSSIGDRSINFSFSCMMTDDTRHGVNSHGTSDEFSVVG